MPSPTIAAVLAEFLAEQKPRVSPKTFAQYQDVVELLQHSLNGYAYLTLSGLDAKRFDQRFKAPGDAHREFCELFGPEHILPNVGEFLGYFMVRKVIAGPSLLRSAGTVTKKLAAWLAEQGYADPTTVEVAAEQGAAAARDLPKAEALAACLADFAEAQDVDGEGEVIEDHFRITRVEPGRLWLEGLDGHERGPIPLPASLSRQCPVGWTIAGTIGRVGRRWRLLEAWNVYPL
jgi:hypothetical protein